MKISPITVAAFEITEAPSLDPIRVTLQHLGEGCGRITIECFGQAWSAFWPGMGKRTLAEFFSNCDVGYLVEHLTPNTPQRPRNRENAYLARIVEAVKASLKENGNTLARPNHKPSSADAEATRIFEVRNIMISHCGQTLTPDNVDSIAAEMISAIETGPCSWAFGYPKEAPTS